MIKKIQALLLTIGLTFVYSQASAQMIYAHDEKYFTIESVTITDLSTQQTTSLTAKPLTSDVVAPTSEEIIPGLDEIINIGKMVWSVVEANRPVANVQTDFATVLPLGIQSAQQLQGWKMPEAKSFNIAYQNLYGVKVVDFTFRLLYTHGGNMDGAGMFLSNVTIVPAYLNVSWGFKFNAVNSVVNIINAGSKENPIAGVEMLLDWRVDNIFTHERHTFSVYVQGDGQTKILE